MGAEEKNSLAKAVGDTVLGPVGAAVGKVDGAPGIAIGSGVARFVGNDDGVPCCTVGISVGVAVGKVEVGLGVKKNIF